VSKLRSAMGVYTCFFLEFYELFFNKYHDLFIIEIMGRCMDFF